MHDGIEPSWEMGQIYERGWRSGSGPTRGLDNQMKIRTRGNGAVGGSMEIGGYEKGQCDWERSLERLRTILLNKTLSIIKFVLYKSPISLIYFMIVYKITCYKVTYRQVL